MDGALDFSNAQVSDADVPGLNERPIIILLPRLFQLFSSPHASLRNLSLESVNLYILLMPTRCGDTHFDNEEIAGDVKEMLAGLKTNAPNNNGYAALQEYAGTPGVYGMVNCWRNVNISSCVSCLEDAYQSALKCLPSSEGRVANTVCFMHYSDYKFANDAKAETKKETLLSYGSYILGALAICLTAVGIGFCVGNTAYRHLQIQDKHQTPEMDMRSSAQERAFQFLQFKYSTLQLATDNFSEAHKIGQGGFGEVFKGNLKDGRELAIKRLFMSGKSRSEDLYTELDIISKAQHRNLVRFLGCCFTDSESFIVYEYLANRSLDRVLFDPEKKKDLDWKKRVGIIIGTARGLNYLHTECQVRIVHRDIKASNILLDLNYRPKIADFGLARFSSCDQSLMTTTIAGTLGYMAPEYLLLNMDPTQYNEAVWSPCKKWMELYALHFIWNFMELHYCTFYVLRGP